MVPVVLVVPFRWFRFGVSGFSTRREKDDEESIMNSKMHACAFDERGKFYVITSRPISRF